MAIFKPRSLRSAMGFSFGFTVLSKIVGYGRQWLLAYCFGVSRDVDIYMMAYGITMLSIYPFTVWFDQLVLPPLVMVREEKGDAAFRALSASFFTFSLLVSVVMAILFVAWIPFASWTLSHGFSWIERREVRHFAYIFIPWVLVIFPYNALSVIMKSLRYYDIVLTSDFIVSCVATLGFALYHRHLSSLPAALAAGYGCASLLLLWRARHFTGLFGSPWSKEMRDILKNFRKMLVMYPIGFIQSAVDKLFQSYLAPGAIAACGYAAQLVAPFLELVAFDETFIVPLSSSEGREHKAHRLLAGLLLTTVPLVCFLMWRTPELIQVLFQYGHFDQRAQALTSSIFRILVLTLCTSTLCTPLVRLLQISGRIYQTSWIALTTTTLGLVFNLVFVYGLHWNVIGTTVALTLATFGTLTTGFVMVSRAGYSIQWLRLSRYLAWAIGCSIFAIWMAGHLKPTPQAITNLIMAGAAFTAIVGGLYWPVRGQIRFILYG